MSDAASHTPTTILERRPALLPGVLGAGILLVAIGPLPYDSYLYIRLAVCAIGWILIAVVFRAWPDVKRDSSLFQERTTWIAFPLIAIVAVFFWVPGLFELGKAAWQIIDAVSAAVFVAYGIGLPPAGLVGQWNGNARVRVPPPPLWKAVAWIVGLHAAFLILGPFLAGSECTETDYGRTGARCVSYE